MFYLMKSKYAIFLLIKYRKLSVPFFFFFGGGGGGGGGGGDTRYSNRKDSEEKDGNGFS